jgi:hypothetical protein
MPSLSRLLDLRRLAAALLAVAGVTAGFTPHQPAMAATVTVGSTTCTYGNFSGDTGGNMVFTCTSGGSTTPQPGVLSLNTSVTAGSIPVTSGSTTITVSRTGMTAGGGAATGTLGVSGGCTLSGSSISFADGSAAPTPASLTVSAGTATAGATCAITLTASGASLGSPSSTNLSIVDPNAPVVFAFSAATSTAFFNGSAVTIPVTRSGGTAGAWNVPFTITGTMTGGGVLVTGGGTLSPTTTATGGMLSFPAGSGGSQTITYTPPSAAPAGVTPPGTITYTLGAPVQSGGTGLVGSIGAGSTNAMSVQAAAGGCTTTASQTVAWTGTQTVVSTVQRGETGTVTMGTATAGRLYTATISETSSTGDKADVHFALSGCPGDFSPAIGPCAQHQQYTGGKLYFSIGPKPAGTAWYLPVCELPATTTSVKFNFRQIQKPTPVPASGPGTASCQFNTCPVLVQFN